MGSQMIMANLRNAHSACRRSLFMPMSPVEFKKWTCPLALYFKCPCSMSLGMMMSPVEFKSWLCRHVDFSGPSP